MSEELQSSPATCANCNNTFSGKFCSQCGQQRFVREHLTVKHFLHQAFHEFTHFDGKIFRSMKLLVLKPGMLSTEYVQGRHKNFISPVSFFILLNLFFFLLGHKILGVFRWDLSAFMHVTRAEQLVYAKMQLMQVDMETFTGLFNHEKEKFIKAMFLVLIPSYALLLWIIFAKLKRTYIEHLIFSVHFHIFGLLFFTVGIPLLSTPIIFLHELTGIQMLKSLVLEPYFSFWVLACVSIYLFFAVRRFYVLKTPVAILATVAAALIYMGNTFTFGQTAVFYLTVWSM